MDRVCPFLALEADDRTAVDGYDPEHRCHAVSPPLELDRETQLQLCLHEGHAECARFRDRLTRIAADRPFPRPTPDATFVGTRQVLASEPAWRALTTRRRAWRRGPVVGAAVLVALGAAAVGASATNGFGFLEAAAISPTPLPSPAATLSVAPTPTATTALLTPTPPATPAPSPTPALTPTPRPTPRIYIVQPNDTLSGIADRFGTTVAAIIAANGLANPNVLSIGQRLVIP